MTAPAARLLGVVDDARFDAHVAPGPHPECPERLAAARDGLRGALAPERWRTIAARPATATELARVHDEAYLAALDTALARGSGHLDADTFYSPGTREAAWLAAGAAAELARTLMAPGDVVRAIALLRPPGHHAEADRAMGFCLLNNVAVAACAALDAGADRVAIVDWDVHHGNGTQHTFEARSDVCFVSTHQWPLYPGTGSPTEVGTGAGRGLTANIALPTGSGDAAVGHAFRRVVLPMLRAHAPDLILVSAGYDAHARDPLGGLAFSTETYGAMASSLLALADDLGHGRVGFLLEGGYDLTALEDGVAATVRAALSERTELSSDAAAPHERAAIEQTRAHLEAAGRVFEL